MEYVFGKGQGPKAPITEMAADLVRLPVEGGPAVTVQLSPIEEEWQRWNDYGIGLLLEGGTKGGQKGELKQAEEVFRKVAEFGKADGWVNLARVCQKEGRINDALAALEKAAAHEKPAAAWVINWLTGQINVRDGMLEDAEQSFESVLKTRIPDRKIDLSLDFEVINELAQVRYTQATLLAVTRPERKDQLKKAIATYHRTLAIDSEDVAAHYGLGVAFGDPAWGNKKLHISEIQAGDAAVDPDDLLRAAASIARPGTTAAQRIEQSRQLFNLIVGHMEGKRPRFQSRLEPLHDVAATLGPVWDAETDAAVQPALARALEATHKFLHERLKPDETAEGRAFAIARRNSPAANMNAQSIVIHPLHRKGAPGIDAPPSPKPALTSAPEPISPNSNNLRESGE
jgi:tetratricopeptide (TPR) repeat protein